MDARDDPVLRKQIRTLDFLRLLFSVLSIGLILVGLYTMRETSRSRGWLRTGGKVVSSRVTEFAGKSGTTYRPMVIYGYSVGSVRLMSNRIAFHSVASSWRSSAERIVARYPAGRDVQVYYNPQDPEQAVLEPGGQAWIWIVGGGVLALLTVWMRIRRGRIERKD